MLLMLKIIFKDRERGRDRQTGETDREGKKRQRGKEKKYARKNVARELKDKKTDF